MASVSVIFKCCVRAIRQDRLILREGSRDKEFHFQNWFKARLEEAASPFDSQGRNSYPDFLLVNHPVGYEVKGLGYPGRKLNFDSNSQVPKGEHNGREIYYVFGRYPTRPDENQYPVLDFVLCHGSFLNADNAYMHENKSFRGLGSYGDILVRDRKMYVVPTPFALVEGAAHHRTLIVPSGHPVDRDLVKVGTLSRCESTHRVTAYEFDLESNEIEARYEPNPHAGRRHVFKALRVPGDPTTSVSLHHPA